MSKLDLKDHPILEGILVVVITISVIFVMSAVVYHQFIDSNPSDTNVTRQIREDPCVGHVVWREVESPSDDVRCFYTGQPLYSTVCVSEAELGALSGCVTQLEILGGGVK